jgi:alpha-galactosidase
VKEGLDKLGYDFILLDDCWSAATRDAQGRLQADPTRFPSGMPALVEYVHTRGLKMGVYTCVGTETCRGGLPGSYGHFEIDAQVCVCSLCVFDGQFL